jgi:hypothetical protein
VNAETAVNPEKEGRTEPRRGTKEHIYGERAFWVKGKEAGLMKVRKLTVVIRPGDRSSKWQADKQWLPLDEPIPVYYLVPGTGNPATGAPPEFEPDIGTTVQIVRRTVTRLKDVRRQDLIFSVGSAVPRGDWQDVREYLTEELAPEKQFSPDSLITIYWIEHLANEKPVGD